MKQVTKKLINGFLTVMLLGYYLLLAWVLHRTSYEHPESLFLSEKLKVLFESPDSTLITLGTTFPTVVYLISVIFVPFGYLFAPILASISLTALLFYVILNDFKEYQRVPMILYLPITTLIFVFHPGIIYSAITGRGVAAVLLFFYLVIRSLFQYYRTQTTFYLSMTSIYLSCLIFCNDDFIWLILAFFPFIAFISIEGLKIKRDQPPILQYFDTVNNVSQRRKLVNRTTAIYVIVFLLPLGTLYLFRTLNQTHAGDSTYFLTSQYANWHVMGDTPIGELMSKGIIKSVGEQTQLAFQVYATLINPLLIVGLFLFRGKVYELLTILAPFIWSSIVLINLQTYLTIEYFLIFMVLGFVALVFYARVYINKKITWLLVFGATMLNIMGGLFYFKHTKDGYELHFWASIRNYKSWMNEKRITEETELASYISSIINKNNKILIDDAAAFSIVAHMRDTKNAILPTDKTFLTVSENPLSGARYICIARNTNSMQNLTVLNEYNLERMIQKKQFIPEIMYQTIHWSVYKLKPTPLHEQIYGAK
ncbi:MAG: hypothetical protein ACOVQE_05640 [Chitinophagaceae bacterium]